MTVSRYGKKKAPAGGWGVVKKYCGSDDAVKVMLKIFKLISEGSGGDKYWDGLKEVKK